MQLLRYEDTAIFKKIATHIIRLLPMYNYRNLFKILDIFSPKLEVEVLDDNIYIEKEVRNKRMKERADQEFFEKIIAILPI